MGLSRSILGPSLLARRGKMGGACVTIMAYPFLSVVVVILLGTYPASSQLADQRAMAALHGALSVPDWGSRDSDYCSWRGVTCRNPNGPVEELLLPRRSLRGDISIIFELRSLKKLDLCGNSFHGPIPPSLGSLTELEYLDFSMNKFAGRIPPAIGALRRLKSLNLSNNLLSGEIPSEFGTLEELQELQISGNKLSGSIPRWVGELPHLRVFSAYENSLVGGIPDNLGSVSQLQVLNLHSNRLAGPIPANIFSGGSLETLILTMNELNGDLPPSIGNCSCMSNLRIGNNLLSGEIPSTIGDIRSLTYLEADNNNFSGEIPPELARCSNLTLLNLAGNRFSGAVPGELGELKNLQEFIASGNNLSGEIPRPLLTCRSLTKFDLTGNMIGGNLPGDLCNSSSSLQFLLLGDNFISGKIPPEIGNCMKLLELQLGGNKLTGGIPPEIGSIRNLQIALNLSFNELDGPLPKEMGKLDKLVSLDVSHNQLAGVIPGEFSGMLSLIAVDFSGNRFSGHIPIFGPFQKSPISSFSGNDGLCGEPSNFSCVDDGGSAAIPRRRVSYKIAIAVIGVGIAAFTAVTLVVALFMLRERREMAAIDAKVLGALPSPLEGWVFVETLKQAVDFDCVVRATMKDANKLKGGAFSTTYQAELPSGLTLSVEKLKSAGGTAVRHRSRMIRELERFCNLGQPNLLKPVGFVICDDAALLLHLHAPNGTLAQLLFGKESPPDWPRRLRIAGGAAEGLACLHRSSVVHFDISSCNIVLDKDFNALLGEIEISKLLDPSKATASLSAIAGSFGYIPPEYAYTMKVTEAGNVYSYGVVLMEILTSKRAVDDDLGEGMDLAKWVRGAAERGEMAEQILDARLSAASFAWRRQMLAVLGLAMLCTDPVPANRPSMNTVVQMLQEAAQDQIPR